MLAARHALAPEPSRVDLDEALLGAQTRHGHVEDLALVRARPAHGQLRRAGVDLHDQGALPDVISRSSCAARSAPTKFGMRPRRSGKPPTPGGRHSRPHFLADPSFVMVLVGRARDYALRSTARYIELTRVRSLRSGLDASYPARRPAASDGAASEAPGPVMRKPVCATMRCSGRTLRPRTCQKRSSVSSVSTAPKPPSRAARRRAASPAAPSARRRSATPPGRSAVGARRAGARARRGRRPCDRRRARRCRRRRRASCSVQFGASPWKRATLSRAMSAKSSRSS